MGIKRLLPEAPTFAFCQFDAIIVLVLRVNDYIKGVAYLLSSYTFG